MKYILIFLTSICLNTFAMNEWYAYTDNVMGGKSELVAQQSQDIIKLSGTVSTRIMVALSDLPPIPTLHPTTSKAFDLWLKEIMKFTTFM